MIEITFEDMNRVFSMASAFRANQVDAEVEMEVGPTHNRHVVCVCQDGIKIDPSATRDPLPEEVPDDPAGP